jgi:hypothetical protein
MRRLTPLCLLAALLAGCAFPMPAIQSEADRRACDDLLRLARAWSGDARVVRMIDNRISRETARYAERRGLGSNVYAHEGGGYAWHWRFVPLTLLAAVDVDPEKSGMAAYRDYMASRSPSERAAAAERGRRCEWD